MSVFQLAEVEQAFRHFWYTGMIREDWNAWADLFTEDVVYHERVFGTMCGRQTVRDWVVPLMEQYGEIYGVYDWHVVDPSGRVVFRMMNRRDHPSGEGVMDFPGVTILHYAGNHRWSSQEDYWADKLGGEQLRAYEEAMKKHDPGHRRKRTRSNWGSGPEWTIGKKSFWDWPDRKRH